MKNVIEKDEKTLDDVYETFNKMLVENKLVEMADVLEIITRVMEHGYKKYKNGDFRDLDDFLIQTEGNIFMNLNRLTIEEEEDNKNCGVVS